MTDLFCRGCGAKNKAGIQFCRNCGAKLISKVHEKEQVSYKLKHKHIVDKNKLLTFLKSKPAIILIIVFGAVIIFAVYANSTPNTVYSSSLSSVPNIMGNGQSSLNIPVTVSSKLNTQMGGVSVQASTNIGSVTGCTTAGNGKCNIVFTPPKQSTSSYADIEISVGSITQKVSVEIIPDSTSTLSLTFDNNQLLADGSSATQVDAKAYDNEGNAVPDGTQISFSLNPGGDGSLSQTNCNSIDGECKVTYTSSINPGTVSVKATSYSASTSQSITLQELPPSSISLTSSANSINADGQSTATITVNVVNKLKAPVENSVVQFSTFLGSVQSQCTTSSSGTCTVTFTAPNQAGTTQITGSVGGLSGSVSIILNPVSDVNVVQFSMTPDVGNPIVPAFALNHNYLNENMVSVTLSNTGSGSFTGTAQLEITGWSSTDTQDITIPSQGSTIVNFNPTLSSNAFSNLQEQSVSYQLTITSSNGNVVYQNTYPASITSFNTMDWATPMYGSTFNIQNNLIAAWVTPDATSIHQLLSQAAQYTSTNSIQGYILYSSGCGLLGLSSCDEFNTVYLQLQAIYNQLRADGMHYVNALQDFAGVQTVYTPTQSIAVNGANCIDGTLVFASAVSATGMDPIIELVPSHAFVCVREWGSGQDYNTVLCVETTLMGSGSSFSDAYNEGNSEFTNYKNSNQLGGVDVNQVLSSGVKSLPS